MSPEHRTDHGHHAGPIWWQESGDPARPLIALVHGTMDRSAGMIKVSRRLDHRFRVLRYDRRGYGRSVAHDGPFDIEHQVDDLVTLLDGRRALVVGHSFGGNVALAAAQRRPDLVAAVATYEAPVSWLSWWPSRHRADPGGDPADRAERFVVELIGAERWAGLPVRTREARRSEGAALVGELTSLAAAPAWTGSRIGVPVVVGVGGRAGHRHRRAAQHLAAEIPGAELVVLPACGHDAPTVAAHQFVTELVERACVRACGPWAAALGAGEPSAR